MAIVAVFDMPGMTQAVENTANTPTATPTLRTPFLGRIQEVVLHREALSAQEIANHVDINRPA